MRKASLSLSVNAIVVFVLAFAMLGVGLFFVNSIRERIVGATDLISPDDLQMQPTSDNPLTVPQQIDVKKKKDYSMQIGYYNRMNQEALEAKIGISDCLDPDGVSTSSSTPTVTSTSQTVSSSEIGAYKIVIKTKEELETGLYVCTMIVYDSDSVNDPIGLETSSEYVYEYQEFFLNINS